MTAFSLPDVAAQSSRTPLPLDWVGMCNIALPVNFETTTLRAPTL